MESLAQKLANGIEKTYSSKDGKPLFFGGEYSANDFADLFAIEEKDRDKFIKAFEIVVNGQGHEQTKINSVRSSALLCLLTFFPLYLNEDTNTFIEIAEEQYYKCFFEVRNKVITHNRPSCIDVVLVSTDRKTLLFLESKLSEYADDTSCRKSYGKSYIPLYENLKFISSHIKMGDSKDKLILKSPDNSEKIYIDGIKQSISHMIGLVRGPHKINQQEYIDLYEKAETLIYGTILFDPKEFNVNTAEYDEYTELFKETIISHGKEIQEEIDKWDDGKHNQGKKIQVLQEVQTYNDIFSKSNLPSDKVKDFYKL
ncbi:MAG: hypothetical protein HDR81_06435 [Bacteroides sp.]|nr:hypothetical protein [Bacteroides sp.]